MLEDISYWIENEVGLDTTFQENAVASIVALLFIWLLRKIVLKIAFRKVVDFKHRYKWQKTSGYIAAALTILLVGRIWFEGIASPATFLGLLTAGVAIALKDPLVNLAGWVYIVWRRPFHLGDRVEIGSFAGDVVDQGLFQFSLMEIGNWVDADQNTGRVIFVPNGMLFTVPLGNFTEGWFQYIWNEVAVRITFESNWREAKSILLKVATKHGKHLSRPAQHKAVEASGRYMIFQSSVKPTVFTSVKENGVQLAVRYLCEPRRRRHSEQGVWEDILTEFSRHEDINFAYPTTRFYDRAAEGPPSASPDNTQASPFIAGTEHPARDTDAS